MSPTFNAGVVIVLLTILLTILKGFQNPVFASSTTLASTTIYPHTNSDADVANALEHGQKLLRDQLFEEAVVVLENVVLKSTSAAVRNEHATGLLLLADAYSNLGQSERAARLLDRLLAFEGLNVDATSFVLNRQGINLAAMGNLVGARESYEQALHVRRNNHHACYNLAMLLHYSIFPTATVFDSFSVLFRAIKLYREALGYPYRDHNVATANPNWDVDIDVTVSKLPEHTQDAAIHDRVVSRDPADVRSTPEGIGGPVNRGSVSRDLAVALIEAGLAHDAVTVLENVMLEQGWAEGAGEEDTDQGLTGIVNRA